MMTHTLYFEPHRDISTGGGAYVAPGATIEAGGDVVGRDKITHIHQGEDVAAKRAELRRIYLQWLANEVNRVPMREVDAQQDNAQADALRINLCDVYIGLNTTTQVEIEAKNQQANGQIRFFDDPPLSALEAMKQNRWAVLLGEPGSGKSTFVHHLIYMLCQHGLAANAQSAAQLQAFYAIWGQTHCDYLPVRVILRDFDAWLRSKAALPAKAQSRDLLDFVAENLKDAAKEAALVVVQDALATGKALLVLDGFDEVINHKQRLYVRDAITALAEDFDPRNRYILTCRTRSYEAPKREGQPDVRVGLFKAVFELARFNDKQIGNFVTAWYAELQRAERLDAKAAADKRNSLLPQLQKQEFNRMAGNPLQLTLMAWVHTEHTLPERRAQLYERATELLLWERESKKREKEGKQVETLERIAQTIADHRKEVRKVLAQAAFATHAQITLTDQENDREKLADVNESGLVGLLAGLKEDEQGEPDKAWGQRMVDAICQRSGLLARRSDHNLTFPHRTFQEYLAASHLIGERNYDDMVMDLLGPPEGLAVWREVILLAVGKDLYVDNQTGRERPERLARRLHQTGVQKRKLDLCVFAAELLYEVGVQTSKTKIDEGLIEQMRHYLQHKMLDKRTKVQDRAKAGNGLGRIGDPRFYGREGLYLPKDAWLGFVPIPAGPFVMGDDEEEDAEKPQHTCSVLTQDYYMARFAVTVAQWQAYCQHQQINPRDLNEVGNHPVVDVSWHEALAYTAWLEKMILSNRILGQSAVAALLRSGQWRLGLPSEAEWEKAARGTDGRIYPWGNTFDAKRANTDGTKIGTSSSVGLFVDGHSPYGCADMSGNVWEWTRSLWGENVDEPDFHYPYHLADDRENLNASDQVYRVVRGGSWIYRSRFARVAVRIGDLPANRNDLRGFRVVVVSAPV